MSELAYAARNFLAQQSSVTSLLGSNDLGPWLFVNVPEATIENTGDVAVVIYAEGSWGSNSYNTARFPTLTIDIWADPTRNPDNSVRFRDADLKIERVYKAIDKFFHLVDTSDSLGRPIMWGTAPELTNRTGVTIIQSTRQGEPDLYPANDDEGALMGRVKYNVQI